MTKKRALGRGLSALLSDSNTDITTSSPDGKIGNQAATKDFDSKVVGAIASIPLEQIETNPFQPRTHFDEEALLELANSIKEHGIIQPITVRKMGYNKFQLISGERRFRASQIAGLEEIPAYIRIANDQSMLEMAIVENVQREDLDAIEEALSYQRLIEECSLTQEQLAEKIGKSRSVITNFLRLLKLPVAIQSGIIDHSIAMGHARALVGIKDETAQLAVYQKVLEESLSVRQTEELAKIANNAGTNVAGEIAPKAKPIDKDDMSFQLQKFADDLKTNFGKAAKLKVGNKGNGKIEITFASEDELNNIIGKLNL
jgi:ParB family chromosome partitioning protein